MRRFLKYNFLKEYLKSWKYEIASNYQVYHNKRDCVSDIVIEASKEGASSFHYFRRRVIFA